MDIAIFDEEAIHQHRRRRSKPLLHGISIQFVYEVAASQAIQRGPQDVNFGVAF